MEPLHRPTLAPAAKFCSIKLQNHVVDLVSSPLFKGKSLIAGWVLLKRDCELQEETSQSYSEASHLRDQQTN